MGYYNPKTQQYGIGHDDGLLVTFCVVVFTGLRASVMEYILAPFGKYHGITKRKVLTRFSEQAWLFVYYTFFWTLGAVRFPWPGDFRWTILTWRDSTFGILRLTG